MVKGLTARAKEMKERLKTVQSSNEMISLRDRLFIYILLILTMIGGTGIVLFPDEAHANWTKNDTCIQCHTALHSTATLDTAVDGVQTTSASIDNDGTDSFELDWMFEGGTWTTNKESVGVMMAVPNGWTVESGTANSPSLTNWSSTWDNVDGGKSWVLMPDTKGDCPVNHDCYSVQFTSPWDHDTASENMACNIGGTTCEAGSAGTDQDGVANRMGTDAVIKTSAGETPGAFTILLYAVGFDDNTKAYKDQTINVTVNAAPPNTDPDDPTNLAQYKSNGSTVISTGGYTEESTVKIEADISDPDGGDTVKLQVDIDGNGSSDCESALVANPSTNVQVSCSVTDGVSYDWQVRTVDDSSANSNWIAFAGTPDFTVDQSAPTGLSNASPGNGANDQSTAVNVVANTATDSGSGSVQYFFEVAEDSGFSVGLQQSSWQAGTSYAATLSYSTTYYWHVKAKDALGNETAYTTTWSFTTSAAPVSSGPNNPSSSVDDGSNGGTQSWISPENAGAQDNSYASRNNLQNETTHYLNATGYGFVIPVGSTINGILVEVDRYAADASAINDAEVKIVKGGVVGSQNKAAGGFWPTSDTDSYQAYGGSSDLWGETWTVADINSANFGVVLSATAGGTKTTPYVDHIRITVYYTASSNSDPDDPTNPAQYKSNGSTVISTGGYTEESSVKIEADISDPDGGDTVKLQVDIDGNGSSDCESALVANPSTNVQVSCSVSDGVSYDWQVRTVDDSSANSSWVAFAGTPDFTVDQTAPSYTWNTPSASTWYKDTDNISVDATITESGVGITNGANCNPKIDGASSSFSGSVTYSTGSGKCTGTLTLGNPSSLTNGAHNLTVEVADDLGNTQQSANRSINIDNSAPTGLSNSTPADTATGQATNVNVVANTASDSDSGSVQYLFEVAEDSGFSVGLQQSGWQAGTSYAPTLAVSTTYYWHVKAKDSVGNETAYTTTWSFTTSTPTVNPDDPANLAQYRSDGSTPIASGNYTEEATIVIEADINDADSGDTIKLQVDLDNNGSVDCEEAGYGANPRTNVQVTCSVSNGVSYDWRVRAQDNNSANSNWVAFAGSPDFISDQAAPGYAWNTPAAGSYYKDGDNISVDVTVTETGIGITNGASCNPKIDGAATEFTGSVTYSTGSGKCTGTLTIDDPSGLTDAAHNLNVEVADNVGNTQQSAPRSINIDNAAPTGLNNSSPANSATDQSISVNVVANAASDSGSGSVQYYFEVAENSGFSVGLQQSGWQPGTSYAPTLAVSTTYYWHVAATDAVGNITAYTATWDFTTGTAANPPDAPSDHNQYRNDGTTLIAQGGSINGTTIKIKATVSDPDTDDTKLEVEILDNGSGYTGTPNCSSDYVTSGSVATAVCTGLSDGIAYKWRARTNDGTDQSAWQIFGGSDPDVTITLDGQFDISACSHCHSAPPADGSLRDTPEGAVIGSHGVTEHDAANCGNCHVEPGAAEYDHRNENIEMTATIHAQTGSSYSKGTSFVQTNSPTLGTCSATYCHGTGSDTWGTDLSAYDTCTKCHGEKTASPTDPQKAPGGSGVDTNNDSSNLDAEVGAHQVHLTAADNISSAIACGECHNVPSSPSDAGHWDTSGARDAAELTFNGPIGDTDGLDNPLTITYSSSQCSNTYCHDGRNFKNGWSTAAQIDSDFETPTWNKPIISGDETVYGGDGNICNNCHGYPPAGSHDPSTDCSGCHDHVDLTDDGFTGVNIAKHINHIVEAQAECITCHNGVPNGASYVTRDIVGSDFTQSYRHVFGGTVTNWDCIVCHREGDATAASTGTVGTTALHGNGGTPVVDMRNVDSISTGWVWDKNNITNAMHTDMDTFCMGCHDSDGASGINVKATDDGVNLSNARALTPFNSTDDVSQGTGGGTANVAGYERTAVLDVFTQFDTTNPSHHAVRGQAYTSHNANWGDTAWVDRTLKDGTRLITDNIYESAQLHCADCHTTDQNAHGGASGFMLQASSIDGTCYLCHNIATYDDVSSSDTRWDHSNDGGVWDTGKGSKLGLYGANAGSICLNCHGGNPVTDGFGGIHGLPAGSDPRSSQQRYRFQGGSYMSYSPSSWTGTSGGTPTCYFDATTDTQPWSNCTQHGGSGSETETGRTADPQYSRGVPGDY